MTPTISSTASRAISSGRAPTNGGVMPSASVSRGRGDRHGLAPPRARERGPGPASSSTATTRVRGRICLTADADPAEQPSSADRHDDDVRVRERPPGSRAPSCPRPRGRRDRRTGARTSGRALPAPRSSGRRASRRSSCRTTSAPYPRTASILERGRVRRHHDDARTRPRCRAAHATACAWLPAETVTRPAASLRRRESESTLFSAPRGLNEPVF